jgi:hypothetical protein
MSPCSALGIDRRGQAKRTDCRVERAVGVNAQADRVEDTPVGRHGARAAYANERARWRFWRLASTCRPSAGQSVPVGRLGGVAVAGHGEVGHRGEQQGRCGHRQAGRLVGDEEFDDEVAAG